MEKQTTNSVLMIEPVAFGFNAQTAVNNYFQFRNEMSEQEIQQKAHSEFLQMCEALTSKGIRVVKISDTPEPHKPDSIFPNNWISFHADGRVALYPMFAPNRRLECRMDILQNLREIGFQHNQIVNYKAAEERNQFLEGTGSMIFDRVNKIAYAALSERTNKALFLQFCSDFGYTPICFSAYQTVDDERLPIYHTNVMMCVATQFAVVCLNAIDNVDERKCLLETLYDSKKELIEISEMQIHHFAGNMIQVENSEGKLFLVMSNSAYHSLNEDQLQRLASFNEIIVVSIPTIELLGGGSVRCMMAEIF